MNKVDPHIKQTGKDKTSRIPIKIIPRARLDKPKWIKMQLPHSNEFSRIKNLLRDNKLNTVCEEASCPNIGECFSQGTATFMILGDLCTRRCPFCDVGHGRPLAPDINEPSNLAQTIMDMKLKYVVITSVDRDDLRDGGAEHFVDCIKAIRLKNPAITIETLVPDFRGRLDKALEIICHAPPDIFNHNLETIAELYKKVRPGSDYQHSLSLLLNFKNKFPEIPTKSGIMLGLGETYEQVIEVLKDLRKHKVDMVTLGQYLQPTMHHLPVEKYIEPHIFD
jgi:lipoyl synthase